VANRIETLKTEKDGLDVWPDLLRYAREGTPIEAIPEDDLERMKWYGVFHRKQTPGYFMMRLRTPGGRLSSDQLRVLAAVARDFGHGTADLTTRENVQLRGLRHDHRVWRDGLQHERHRANLRVMPDGDGAKHRCADADGYIVFDGGVTLDPPITAMFPPAGRAQGHLMVQHDVIANLSSFTNHHASAVIYEEPLADARAGVNLDAAGEEPRNL